MSASSEALDDARALAALLSPERGERLEAAAAVRGAAAVWALRDVLLGDEDADVRAAAAERLRALAPRGAGADARVRALHDALFDTHPSVRLAACRGLARSAEPGDEAGHAALATVSRLVREEPVWWVRRAACFALARAAGRAALPTLAVALDDPFWRVRHAAVRALLALGEADAATRDALAGVVASADSDRARAAAGYLLRRLAPDDRRALAVEAPVPGAGPRGPADDPDPAVVAARLAAGQRATLAELVEYLGDPHATLRASAAARLRRPAHLPALRAACVWLDEPRIPYAAEAVLALLDGLDDPAALVDAILADPDALPGASLWAIGHPLARDRPEALARAARARSPAPRRAAATALADLAEERRRDEDPSADRAEAELVALLDDPDADVRRIAAHGLVRLGRPAGLAAVLAATLDAGPGERLIAAAARALGEVAALERAAASSDPRTASVALAALFARGALSTDALARARASADPWIRRAVLDEEGALAAASEDPDPVLRRVAFGIARGVDGLRAARAVSASVDPWLRAEAASRLARAVLDESLPVPEREADLARVLRAATDPDPAVRAAAAELALAAPDAALRLARLEAARPAQEPIPSADRSRPPLRRDRAVAGARRPRTFAIASARPLGKTGIDVAPLAISGVNEPSIASLHRAADHGANLFFWEPRHRALRAFLRDAGPEARVVCGSYHAGAGDIARDIRRTLRALGRERLDVFLLFWVRSPARLGEEPLRALEQARAAGLVGAIGFSCHDRDLVEAEVRAPDRPWDVVMVRHSAAHPGAERTLFPAAAQRGVGVLAFSATSYGRLLEPGASGWAPGAADCYRYGLSQPGVSAVISAPRGGAELVENLAVLERHALDDAALARMRAHGAEVRGRALDFASHIRRFPAVPEELGQALLDRELAQAGAPFEGP